MIKEAKNVDFSTTGKQPSEQDFARISEWIRKDREMKSRKKRGNQLKLQAIRPTLHLRQQG